MYDKALIILCSGTKREGTRWIWVNACFLLQSANATPQRDALCTAQKHILNGFLTKQ